MPQQKNRSKSDDAHRSTTRDVWNDGKIQRKILSRIILDVGLFANKEKDKNLDACLRRVETELGLLNVFFLWQGLGLIPRRPLVMKGACQGATHRAIHQWKGAEQGLRGAT